MKKSVYERQKEEAALCPYQIPIDYSEERRLTRREERLCDEAIAKAMAFYRARREEKRLGSVRNRADGEVGNVQEFWTRDLRIG